MKLLLQHDFNFIDNFKKTLTASVCLKFLKIIYFREQD